MAADARQRQVTELHDATDALMDAWDELTAAAARRLEDWDDSPERVANAYRRVRLATGAANAALDRALADVMGARGDA